MKVSDWLTATTHKLTKAGIGTARLDALVLAEDVTEKDRAWLLAYPNFKLTAPQVQKLDKHINQRSKHVPLAYIRGKTEFYGREFIINKHVLEPRPETETMIDLLKTHPNSQLVPTTVFDIGTGSGAIAVTAKLELPDVAVVATDIDPNCIAVAKQNTAKHHVDINFTQGDLLEPLANYNPKHIILLCNLPYVPNDYRLNSAAMNEPRRAIFGGIDGLDLYRRLFMQIDLLSAKPGIILTESLPFQHQALAAIAKKHNYTLNDTNNFIQLFCADLA